MHHKAIVNQIGNGRLHFYMSTISICPSSGKREDDFRNATVSNATIIHYCITVLPLLDRTLTDPTQSATPDQGKYCGQH